MRVRLLTARLLYAIEKTQDLPLMLLHCHYANSGTVIAAVSENAGAV